MATFVIFLLVFPTAWILYNCHCLYQNYLKISRLAIPHVFSPVNLDNPLWIAFQLACGSAIDYFPFAAFSFTRHCRLGWEVHDRYRTHARLGDAFIVVTPGKNWLFIADDEAVTDVFARNRDFKTPTWQLEVLGVFGPNIATSEGQDWQRQRKLTATPFNEQKSPLVWEESLRQASDMLKSWRSAGSDGFTTTADDTRTLALHVLAYVAFQKSYPFQSVSKAGVQDVDSMTYRDSLAIILSNAFTVMVLPLSVFSFPFGKKWNQIGWAIHYFRSYMMKQLKDEQYLVRTGKSGTGTLVSNLVRASVDATNENGAMKPLTEDEILGNIFVFNFAGHDTTALSLASCMLLLVANPDVQDWVHEELEYYLEDSKSSDYNDVFPKLKRTLAVLLETLRLYNPLIGTPKWTGEQPTYLDINGKTFLVPADTLVCPALQTLHTDPRRWGKDSLTWRPQRWISHSNSTARPQLESEELFKPSKGTYFPWAEGARNCPGRKFAQVEFVATLVALLRDHIAEPVPKSGESLDEARQRTLKVVQNSSMELLLQMRNPSSVHVRWKERKASI
ncbi:MAG: hypothetical protein M1822_000906 [Bathelium mastoideum]|nr:MAG: hypothetical protein M1822_000906 [Bathelium mastoideum]